MAAAVAFKLLASTAENGGDGDETLSSMLLLLSFDEASNNSVVGVPRLILPPSVRVDPFVVMTEKADANDDDLWPWSRERNGMPHNHNRQKTFIVVKKERDTTVEKWTIRDGI